MSITSDAALTAFRKKIDDLDTRIIEGIEERCRVVDRIVILKHDLGIPLYDGAREEEIVDRLQKSYPGVPQLLIKKVYEVLFAYVRNGKP